MFKSLLNAVSVDSLILDVFIILAVVVAGSLIFYFLWEAMTTILAGRNTWKREKKPAKDDELKFEEDTKPGLASFDLEKQEEPVVEEQVSLTAETAEEEQPEEVLDETALVDVDEEKAEEEKEVADEEISEEEKENAERRAYLEARRQELLKRMQEESESAEEETAEEETAEEAEPVEEEPDEEAEVEESAEESVDELAAEREALEAEKAKYRAMVAELEDAKKALAEAQAPTNTLAGLTLDELKARLAEAEDRLKATEKEFKQCKKEYIPLQRVWATHEKDEKKLRRKEALVARQKVLLYGVNNYADIDEEKAKKLSEDLDLLDGLKLSVQHCEEVMKNNEERYPLLEKMYNVLKERDEEIRADIEKLSAEIARIEAENE